MPDRGINGSIINVRSLTEGESNHDRLREWLKDISAMVESIGPFNRRNSVFIHRNIGGGATSVVDIENDSMYDAALGLDDLLNDTELLQPGKIFKATVFIRTDADEGLGYNQVTMLRDDEDSITTEVDTTGVVSGTNVRLTNTTGGSLEVVALIQFANPASFATTHTPVVA